MSTLEALPIGMRDDNQNKLASALGPTVMWAIGRKLRAMYADIIAEGVPERFAAILRRLDEASDEDSRFARWIAKADGGRYPHTP